MTALIPGRLWLKWDSVEKMRAADRVGCRLRVLDSELGSDEGMTLILLLSSMNTVTVIFFFRDTDISPSKKRLMIADTTVTPFDQIMNTMIATHSGAPAAKKQSRSRSIHSDSSSGSRKKGEYSFGLGWEVGHSWL